MNVPTDRQYMTPFLYQRSLIIAGLDVWKSGQLRTREHWLAEEPFRAFPAQHRIALDCSADRGGVR
jgi:hypothetical protein